MTWFSADLGSRAGQAGEASLCACVFLKCVLAKDASTTTRVQITRDMPGNMLARRERRSGGDENEEAEEVEGEGEEKSGSGFQTNIFFFSQRICFVHRGSLR